MPFFIRFVEECKRHGFKQIQEAGGIHFSYAKLKGERWDDVDTGDGQSNIPVVIKSGCQFKGNKDDECWKVVGRCMVCEHYRQTVL